MKKLLSKGGVILKVEQATASINANRLHKIALTIFACGAFLLSLDMMVVTAILPMVVSNYHVSQASLGWLTASYALSYAIAALVIGPQSERLGRRKMLIIGISIFGISNLFCGFVSSYSLLLVFRFIAGIGAAIVIPNIWAAVASIFPFEKLGQAMSVLYAAMSLATILGIPAGAFMAEQWGWNWLFTFFGIISIPLLVAFVMLPMGKQNFSEQEGYLNQYAKVFTHAGAVKSLFSSFFWNLSLFGMFSFVGTFYFQYFAFTTEQIGTVVMAGGIANFFGSILGGKFGDKLGKSWIVGWSALVAALSVLLFTFAWNLILTVLFQLIWSLSVGMGVGSLSAIISSQVPHARNTIMSLNTFAIQSAIFIGGIIGGVLIKDGVYWPLGLLCSLSALVVVILIPASKNMETMVE